MVLVWVWVLLSSNVHTDARTKARKGFVGLGWGLLVLLSQDIHTNKHAPGAPRGWARPAPRPLGGSPAAAPARRRPVDGMVGWCGVVCSLMVVVVHFKSNQEKTCIHMCVVRLAPRGGRGGKERTYLRDVLERGHLPLQGLGGEEAQLEGHDGGRDPVHLFFYVFFLSVCVCIIYRLVGVRRRTPRRTRTSASHPHASTPTHNHPTPTL